MAGAFLPLSLLLLLLLLLASVAVSLAQECDPKCSTQNCDSDGVCICELLSNSTMLLGDRPFFGGEFCDTPRTMCDGSNSFWCENGLCNEIIQGENYTCVCKDGYAGDHCELEGVPCGDLYCYHNAECIQADVPCDCSADWKGSEDCSTPTMKSSTNNTNIEPVKTGGEDKDKWYLPFSVAIVVVVVAGIVVLGAKSLKKRSIAATEFHKLRQVQMRGFIDEDEDAFAHAPLSKAELA